MTNSKIQGFTLIELLVIIAIVGVLSSIVLASLRDAQQSARNAVRVESTNQIAIAIELYKLDNDDVPPGDDGVEYINGSHDWIPGLVPRYMPVVPSDPIDIGEFRYHYMRQGVNHEVIAFMEDHGSDPTCNDGGPSGCDYYEKGSEFLAIYNPGASGWNLTATSTPPEPTPDTTPPSVFITSPVADTTVSDEVSIAAFASDDVGVTGVQFILNFSYIGAEDTQFPYALLWNSSTTPDGSYTLGAIARDDAGNTASATPISITISNASPPPPTPVSGRIAFVSNRDGNSEIYVMNADGTGQTNLTNNSVAALELVWSPNGAKIAFVSYRDGNQEIYMMNADGTGQTRLTNNSAIDSQPAWSSILPQ